MATNINDLKLRLTRDDIVSILSSYGYIIDTKTFKFCLRDEKTASAVINQDNSIHDYGGNFHGDIFDVLQEFHNMSLSSAIRAVAEHLNYVTDDNVSRQPQHRPIRDIQVSTLSEEVYKKMLSNLEWYDSKKELQTFKNSDYKSEALSICPLWVFQQATPRAIELFKNITTYDFKNQTLIIKIHNYQGKLISYKRRRLNGGKWITAKDTHPNKQCLVNITDEEKNIFIVEGHRDYLTAILLGINILMIPTVSYKTFTDYEVSLLKNRDVIFMPDYSIKENKETTAQLNNTHFT